MTLVLLFGFQGKEIIEQPLVIAILAVPILVQVYLNAGLAYWLNRFTGEIHCVAAPSALIGASNFFELAVAAAVSLFGLQSGAALATWSAYSSKCRYAVSRTHYDKNSGLVQPWLGRPTPRGC